MKECITLVANYYASRVIGIPNRIAMLYYSASHTGEISINPNMCQRNEGNYINVGSPSLFRHHNTFSRISNAKMKSTKVRNPRHARRGLTSMSFQLYTETLGHNNKRKPGNL